MQRVLFADAINGTTQPRDRAQVARAWEALEERKRILRMKPKPKDVAVEGPKSKRQRRITDIDIEPDDGKP